MHTLKLSRSKTPPPLASLTGRVWEAVAHRKPDSSARLWHFAGLILTSLMFGMMMAFGSRVLRSAMVAVFTAGFLGVLGVAFANRRANSRAEVASKKL